MKIGDTFEILEYCFENSYYAEYRVVGITKKKIYKRYYNMYLCENMKTRVKTTITDIDLKLEEKDSYKKRKNKKIRGVIYER